ncbi:hypothetical protein [Candidatus Igneacidithiobacillus taiwanensis]|uniref:hypothetical protein n=1 Tax=Candidatus Igneacidithiobacillus taiwanensis TaxID=1945924 RepID=UPI00289E71CE|nr:hypothetical protein [Candidatus Igneacidithiobacillus taiwanensis]
MTTRLADEPFSSGHVRAIGIQQARSLGEQNNAVTIRELAQNLPNRHGRPGIQRHHAVSAGYVPIPRQQPPVKRMPGIVRVNSEEVPAVAANLM